MSKGVISNILSPLRYFRLMTEKYNHLIFVLKVPLEGVCLFNDQKMSSIKAFYLYQDTIYVISFHQVKISYQNFFHVRIPCAMGDGALFSYPFISLL